MRAWVPLGGGLSGEGEGVADLGGLLSLSPRSWSDEGMRETG